MKFSGYNIFSKFRESENYFIVNLLTGNADILEPVEAAKIESLRDGVAIDDSEFTMEMMEKGYLSEETEEKKLFRQRYLDFIDSREKDEIQIFFITNYSCNFACSYCYQDQYENPLHEIKTEVIDSFFNHISREFAGRKKYITLFGGEPLLSGLKQKETIKYLLKKSNEYGLELCFVTNGYNLEEYVPILKTARIREIQVTLDGTEDIHNKRRFLKGGKGTFNNIVTGIEACLSNNIPVNLRMVVDNENIDNLPELAEMAIKKGWTGSPLFKTQLGRNYELHHCQTGNEKLLTRVTLYERLYNLIKKHPSILEFHKPAYSVSRFLAENGELPEPLFDSCPACKTEWAFDYTGKIYPCTATVGKAEEVLGTFYPSVNMNSGIIDKWESRDVTSIEKCKSCNLQLACGGGCGSVAKNNSGKIDSPDCRPVRELLEIGFSAYFNEQLKN